MGDESFLTRLCLPCFTLRCVMALMVGSYYEVNPLTAVAEARMEGLACPRSD
jgi:hypothetical protein